MSDAKTLHDGVTSILSNDFVEWLTARKGDEAACPVCKYTAWSLLTTPDGEYASLIALSSYPATAGNMGLGKGAVQIECKRCAYLAFFTASVVSDWVKAGKPEFKPDPSDG